MGSSAAGFNKGGIILLDVSVDSSVSNNIYSREFSFHLLLIFFFSFCNDQNLLREVV